METPVVAVIFRLVRQLAPAIIVFSGCAGEATKATGIHVFWDA